MVQLAFVFGLWRGDDSNFCTFSEWQCLGLLPFSEALLYHLSGHSDFSLKKQSGTKGGLKVFGLPPGGGITGKPLRSTGIGRGCLQHTAWAFPAIMDNSAIECKADM